MRTGEERLERMHRRAAELRQKRETVELRAWGGASAALLLGLSGLTASALRGGHGISAGAETASSLLAESAGGYVLTAVCAFMLGVLIMALKQYLKRKGKRK